MANLKVTEITFEETENIKSNNINFGSDILKIPNISQQTPEAQASE